MRALLLLLVLALTALVVASAFLFVWPREDDVQRADAVLVLAGNFRVRLDDGRRLWQRGVAPTLVLSVEPDEDFPRHLCGRARVVCFVAKPYSTRGEAETFSRLARRRGWKRVVLVSSTYHITRARMLFRRCFDGKVYAVGAHETPFHLLHGLVWEWPKLGLAVTLKRDC